MFNALNRFIGALDAEPQERKRSSGIHNASGFQVLRNTDANLPIEPWFDYIIGINGRMIDNPDSTLFATELRNCAGSTISFGLYSAKGQRIRDLYVPVPPAPTPLGLSLQWVPLSATEDVWHILDVAANSPADVAGLLPYGDYVIGSPEGPVRGEGGLGELVEEFLDRPLRLHVYNHEYAVVRPVTITPSRSWGGTGALGCILGYGALHRLPPPLDEPPQAPGETLFDSEPSPAFAKFADKDNLAGTNSSLSPPPPQGSAQFLVPADMPLAAGPPRPATSSPSNASKPPSGGPTLTPQTRGKQKARHTAASGLDDYFNEGEAKSRELDAGAGSGKKEGALPPPPPKGGPPRGGSTPKPTDEGEPMAEKESEEEKT